MSKSRNQRKKPAGPKIAPTSTTPFGVPEVSSITEKYDCVRIRLHPKQVSPSEIGLDTDLNFAESWENLERRRFFRRNKTWRFLFAISRGELVFDLNQLTSPIEKRNCRQELPVTEIITRETTRGESASKESQMGAKLGSELSAISKLTGELAVGGKSSSTNSAKTSDEFKLRHIAVHEKGNEGSPKWTIRSQAGDEILEGKYAVRLATFDIEDTPCSLTLRFEISFDGIRITGVDSSEYHSAKRKKQAALLALMKKFIRETSRGCLSEVSIDY